MRTCSIYFCVLLLAFANSAGLFASQWSNQTYAIDLKGHVIVISNTSNGKTMKINFSDSMVSSQKTHFKVITDYQDREFHYFLLEVYAYLLDNPGKGELGSAGVYSLFILKVDEEMDMLGFQSYNFQDFIMKRNYSLKRTFEGFVLYSNELYIRIYESIRTERQFVVKINLGNLSEGFVFEPSDISDQDQRFNISRGNDFLVTNF